MNTNHIRLGILLLTLLTACQDDPASSLCGPDGEEIVVDDVTLCGYEQEIIIETGFNCPAALPSLHVIQNIGFCSSLDELTNDLLERALDIFFDRRPTARPSAPDAGADTGPDAADAGADTADTSPDAVDVTADGLDNDCDGTVDEPDETDCPTCCTTPCAADSDCPASELCVDGLCTASAECASTSDCPPDRTCVGGTCELICTDGDGDGFCAEDGDCDDANAATNPAATEIPDGVDNDCDGLIDE